jgi:hypothetical protein
MQPNEYKDILIKLNIEKSDEAIEIAELAIDRNALTTVLNRVYYAMFYTVTALAIKHDFKTVKHTAMMTWFNKKFVYQEKIFDKQIAKIYVDAYKFRQKGDYDTAYKPNIEKAKVLLTTAKEFIQIVRKEIESQAEETP